MPAFCWATGLGGGFMPTQHRMSQGGIVELIPVLGLIPA